MIRHALAVCTLVALWPGGVATAVAVTPSEASPVLQPVSVTPDGGTGNGPSGTFGVAISSEGTSVAFSSMATDLVAVDSDPTPDIYVRAVDAGSPTVLVSANASGEPGNGLSTSPSLAADGSRIVFLSAASDLDPVDDDERVDAYVADLRARRVHVVSTSSSGVKANGPTTAAALSAGGRVVAFVSAATNLHGTDTDALPDLYVKRLCGGTLRLASVDANGKKGQPGAFGIGAPSLSADGSRVAFSTDAALDPADVNGLADVYVKDMSTGALMLASARVDGTSADAASTEPMLAADGDAVVFASFASDLSPEDASPDSDVYLKDLSTGALSLVSTTAAGVKADGQSTLPAVSGDGRVVAFASDARGLRPGGSAGPAEIYVKDLRNGAIVPAVMNARPDALSVDPALSRDGARVAFATLATNLSPADLNGWADVYMAKVADEAVPLAPSAAHSPAS